jgi:hypothetical protein
VKLDEKSWVESLWCCGGQADERGMKKFCSQVSAVNPETDKQKPAGGDRRVGAGCEVLLRLRTELNLFSHKGSPRYVLHLALLASLETGHFNVGLGFSAPSTAPSAPSVVRRWDKIPGFTTG